VEREQSDPPDTSDSSVPLVGSATTLAGPPPRLLKPMNGTGEGLRVFVVAVLHYLAQPELICWMPPPSSSSSSTPTTGVMKAGYHREGGGWVVAGMMFLWSRVLCRSVTSSQAEPFYVRSLACSDRRAGPPRIKHGRIKSSLLVTAATRFT